jgi:DNA-binding CsgD family transcriptional regulator
MDAKPLAVVATHFAGRAGLTPGEWKELMRIAQGFACKDSASAANVSPETIRARRKRIYRKLDLEGAGEVISSMLAVSLRLLSEQVEALDAMPAQDHDADASATVH